MTAEDVLPTTKPEAVEWNDAIIKVQDNLSLYSKLRGGRASTSPFVLKSKRRKIPKGERVAL